MPIIVFCIFILIGLLPCVLAYYWKRRNALPWLFLWLVPIVPLATLQVRRFEHIYGANPMGGSKLGMLISSALISAVLVSILVALIPRREQKLSNQALFKKKHLFGAVGLVAFTLLSSIFYFSVKGADTAKKLEYAQANPKAAAIKALSQADSNILREAVNYWSFDDPAGVLEWLAQNPGADQNSDLRATVLYTWILNDPVAALPSVESFLESDGKSHPLAFPLSENYKEHRKKLDR